MSKIKCCYKCPDRSVSREGDHIVTCHSTCKRYFDEVVENNQEKELIQQHHRQLGDYIIARHSGSKKK